MEEAAKDLEAELAKLRAIVSAGKSLSEYLMDDDGEWRDFEAHLAECLGCHDCLQALQRTVSICRRTGGQPVPSALSERLAHCFPDPT